MPPERIRRAHEGAVPALRDDGSAERDIDQVSRIAGTIERGRPLKLLVLDLTFTLEMVRQRGLEESVTCRDLRGFFSHVWTVHPFATLLTSDDWTPRYGRPVGHEINAAHTFIEGKVGRFAWLRNIFPLNFLLSQASLLISLLRLIRREKIDVIRAGDAQYLGLLGWALARLSGIPLVVRVGANYEVLRQSTGTPLQPRLFRSIRTERKVEQFVLKRADLVAGANQENLDFALRSGARPEHSTLFRYGNLIDKRHFTDPASRNPDPAAFRRLELEPKKFLLTIARLEANALKYPEDIVKVLARLRDRGHDIKAVIAGEGRLRPALVEQARELGVADQLILPGNLEQEWLAELIPHAAAFVSPHAGRALSEAALGAAPVVAYDIDWQRELIETGVTGFLIPHRAWEAMSDGVERYLRDPELARAMGRALRERALDMLDADRLDRHEREQYAKLLGRFEGPSSGAGREPPTAAG
jgi:glycosyltransferase involved in cell wall biosynthesis